MAAEPNNVAEEAADQVQFHPLQLTRVAAVRSLTYRRPKREGDPDEPQFASSRPIAIGLGEGETFRARVRISVDIPVLGTELFHAEVRLEADFVNTGGSAISVSTFREFARRQLMYLVWPFARAYIDQLATMAGVGIPPLPLIIRG